MPDRAGETLLRVEKLNVSFPGPAGTVRAVRDVSFELGRERLGVVGDGSWRVTGLGSPQHIARSSPAR